MKSTTKDNASKNVAVPKAMPSSLKASTPVQGTPAQGPVAEEEIRAVLLQRTQITTNDLVAVFKARLKTSEV